jgi:hypothetical protein
MPFIILVKQAEGSLLQYESYLAFINLLVFLFRAVRILNAGKIQVNLNFCR